MSQLIVNFKGSVTLEHGHDQGCVNGRQEPAGVVHSNTRAAATALGEPTTIVAIIRSRTRQEKDAFVLEERAREEEEITKRTMLATRANGSRIDDNIKEKVFTNASDVAAASSISTNTTTVVAGSGVSRQGGSSKRRRLVGKFTTLVRSNQHRQFSQDNSTTTTASAVFTNKVHQKLRDFTMKILSFHGSRQAPLESPKSREVTLQQLLDEVQKKKDEAYAAGSSRKFESSYNDAKVNASRQFDTLATFVDGIVQAASTDNSIGSLLYWIIRFEAIHAYCTMLRQEEEKKEGDHKELLRLSNSITMGVHLTIDVLKEIQLLYFILTGGGILWHFGSNGELCKLNDYRWWFDHGLHDDIDLCMKTYYPSYYKFVKSMQSRKEDRKRDRLDRRNEVKRIKRAAEKKAKQTKLQSEKREKGDDMKEKSQTDPSQGDEAVPADEVDMLEPDDAGAFSLSDGGGDQYETATKTANAAGFSVANKIAAAANCPTSAGAGGTVAESTKKNEMATRGVVLVGGEHVSLCSSSVAMNNDKRTSVGEQQKEITKGVGKSPHVPQEPKSDNTMDAALVSQVNQSEQGKVDSHDFVVEDIGDPSSKSLELSTTSSPNNIKQQAGSALKRAKPSEEEARKVESATWLVEFSGCTPSESAVVDASNSPNAVTEQHRDGKSLENGVTEDGLFHVKDGVRVAMYALDARATYDSKTGILDDNYHSATSMFDYIYREEIHNPTPEPVYDGPKVSQSEGFGDNMLGIVSFEEMSKYA